VVGEAKAFWTLAPGTGEIRPVAVRPPGAGEVLVRTRWSGVSRGTEALVWQGRVPRSQWAAMRAPFQEGDFSGPVKYGYLNVGEVEAGPGPLVGRTVFCLFPHQTAYVVPAAAVVPVPPRVPPERAVLAGAVETAVNALWDAPPLLGDRITVIGAGMIGCSVARLAACIPGTEVTLVDTEPGRSTVAARLGVAFTGPDEAPGEQDLVVHASASAAGLARALELVRPDGTVLELSWYGDASVPVPLGAEFHARRLTLRASQVGTVAAARRATRRPGDRLRLALELLADPAFDALLSSSAPFDELPAVMARLAAGSPGTLCQLIAYPEG
jgi:threonine dehydrogenase-like Zn-dependent dehydrogenase